MSREVFFHGALGEKYGKRHALEVVSISEIVRCFSTQVPGFREDLKAGAYRVVRKNGESEMDLGPEDVDMRLGLAPEVHFYPVIAGGKDRTVGKIILGASLLGFAALGAGAAAGGYGSSALGGFLGGTVTFGAVGLLGASLVLGGVAQKLAPSPEVDNYGDRSEDKPSFLFNGPVNVNAQGVAVPLVYGRVRTGTVVVSASLTTENIPYDEIAAKLEALAMLPEGKGGFFSTLLGG